MQKAVKKFSNQKGFSLTEMLVAVAILGIIVTIVITQLNPVEQIKKANDGRRKDDLSQVQKALEFYYQDKGVYPVSLSWGSTWQPYMQKLPLDPSPGRNYVYFSPVSANGQTYYLYASLERGGKDPQACNNGNACQSATTNGVANSCGGVCNFGLSSSNVTP